MGAGQDSACFEDSDSVLYVLLRSWAALRPIGLHHENVALLVALQFGERSTYLGENYAILAIG